MSLHQSLHDNLAALELSLPVAPKPIASYVPAVRTGDLVIVSGQLPMVDGELACTGFVPGDVSVDDAQDAARRCVLNGLAALGALIEGDYDRLVRVVRVGVFVQSDPGFTDQALVANGASNFLQELLGENGRHARAAVGCNALPLGAPVEIEFTFEVRD